MLKDKKSRSLFDDMCEDIGKIAVFVGFAYSVFVLTTTLFASKKGTNHYDRLKKSYEGLSPDEY
ncbi:MAG: hypothetical protein LBB93_00870 [Elusimicrobiota bacterium]|jgi:hypothetical protein|nr:hypothetical protein [Elusimicrobiota bacterium]